MTEAEWTDEEVLALARELRQDHPDLDRDHLSAGRLAGPADADRPDLPVWDYLGHVVAHPEVALDALTAARFPVRLLDGTLTVTSVDEEARPLSASSTAPRPPWIESTGTVVGRYAALRDAGCLAWDAGARGLVQLRPLESFVPVIEAWVATLGPGEPSR